MEPVYNWAISKCRARTCENNDVQGKVHRQLESGERIEDNERLSCSHAGVRPSVSCTLARVLTPSGVRPLAVRVVYVHSKG